MKKFAVFDIDGTVYRDAMSFIVAEPVVTHYGTEEEKQRLATATRTWKERGSTESYWAYNKTILELFEKVLPKVAPNELKKIADTLLETRGRYRYAYTTELIKKLKAEGRVMVAISGSIKDIVEPFALNNGFDIVIASGLEVVNGAFTGKRVTQTNKAKDEVLKSLIKEHGLTLKDSIAVGDTHRDTSLLALVEKPIAFNPNAALYETAQKHGWPVVLERKNMIYELRMKNGSYNVANARPSHTGTHQEDLQ